VLIGVKPSYFKGDGYINQKRWVELWQKALQVDYTPIVNIKVVKPKREGQTVEAAAVEAAKYSVKDTDYIREDKREMDEIIKVLAGALKNRRLIGYGKLFKDVKTKLGLVDVEDETADLVGDSKYECTCPLCGGTLEQSVYEWHIGYSNYIKRG
jgi:plasmid rolling circle replication initiator protein Rep